MSSTDGGSEGRPLQGVAVVRAIERAQFALGLLGGKWVVPIVYVLASRPSRHGELRRALGPKLHEKVLTETLRRMEEARLIQRDVVAQIPPSVSYSLTDAGRSLLEPIQHLSEWTTGYWRQIEPQEKVAE